MSANYCKRLNFGEVSFHWDSKGVNIDKLIDDILEIVAQPWEIYDFSKICRMFNLKHY